MPNWLKTILVNWKTTGAGAVTAVMTSLVVFNVLTEEQAMAVGGAVVAFGLLFARDGDKSSQDSGVRPDTGTNTPGVNTVLPLVLVSCLALGLGGCSTGVPAALVQGSIDTAGADHIERVTASGNDAVTQAWVDHYDELQAAVDAASGKAE